MASRQTQDLKAALTNSVAPAMATPLHENGYGLELDLLPNLVELLVRADVGGLFVGGTTGEGILLGLQERKSLHEAALAAVKGRIPVILHVGANDTASSVEMAAHAETLAADAIAAVTPYYYGLDEDSIVQHYRAVAAAAPTTPFLAYDIPHLAVNGVKPTLLPRLAAEIPNFAGMKTSNVSAQYVRQALAKANPDTLVLAGNERIALALLALGATGLISGLSTAIPEPFVALTKAFADGDLVAARAIQAAINRILDLIPFGRRIGAIKTILATRGVPVGPPVPPRKLPPIDWQVWEQIGTHLASVGVGL